MTLCPFDVVCDSCPVRNKCTHMTEWISTQKENMNKFIGTKIIKAKPMTRGEYSEYEDRPVETEKIDDPGFLVGYPNAKGEFTGPLEGGCDYISWSPEDVFDASYKGIAGMPFGLAVEAMKKGCRVARVGWNGAGMFAYLVPAASYPAQTGAAKGFFGDSAIVPYREYMALKTAQGDVATWAPSGSDALADDWVIVE